MDPVLQNTIVASWAGRFDTCYVTLEELDAYLQTKLWWYPQLTDINTLTKTSVAIQATRDIDGASNWQNNKFFYWQSLEFPRYTNIYGWYPSTSEPDQSFYDYITQDIDQLDMQRRVKRACCEQAFWIIRNGGYNEHLERQQLNIRNYSETIGPIHESATYREGSGTLCREAFQQLRIYIAPPRLVRG